MTPAEELTAAKHPSRIQADLLDLARAILATTEATDG